MSDKATSDEAIRKLQRSLTERFIEAYVNGLLPPGWQFGGKLHVQPFPGRDELVLNVAAWSPTNTPVGARLVVSVARASDVEGLSAELAHELRRKIEVKIESDYLASDEIRFSLEPGGVQPLRATEGASGYDLHARTAARWRPGQVVVVHCGVCVELPSGTEGQVRPRSSMSKRGLVVVLGTVDRDYRGEVGATIANFASEDQSVDAGDRVAQLVIARVEHRPWVQVEAGQLRATARGAGGFGSTGK